MTLHFANDVFLLHFALEPAECAFERLVIAESDFSHFLFTSLLLITLRTDFVRWCEATANLPSQHMRELQPLNEARRILGGRGMGQARLRFQPGFAQAR
jgi:hypothetical protein